MGTQQYRLTYLYAFILGIVISLSLFILLKPSASAATINVVAGTDAINDNDQCQLSEAIENINDQAQTNNDCPAGDGNNDTINLPAGTVTLTENSYSNNLGEPTIPDGRIVGITHSVIIQGVSPDQTIIDNNDIASLAGSGLSSSITFRNLKIIGVISEGGPYGNIGAFGTLSTVLENVVVDGQGGCTQSGISLFDYTDAEEISVTLNNVTVKNISCAEVNDVVVYGFMIDNSFGGTANLNIENVTITNLQSEGYPATGIVYGANVLQILDGEAAQGSFNANFTNVTIESIRSDVLANAIASSFFNQSSSNIQATSNYTNITITDIQADSDEFQPDGFPVAILGGAIGYRTATVGSGSVSILETYKNTIIGTSQHGSIARTCVNQNFNDALGAPDNVESSIVSLGGNLTEDASCDFMNQETDRTGQANLSNYLAPLADNGGSVPTMALLPGNPAIDGGVCGEGVPSTDARGITRPQGKTCDSGAYEVE